MMMMMMMPFFFTSAMYVINMTEIDKCVQWRICTMTKRRRFWCDRIINLLIIIIFKYRLLDNQLKYATMTTKNTAILTLGVVSWKCPVFQSCLQWHKVPFYTIICISINNNNDNNYRQHLTECKSPPIYHVQTAL